MKYKSIYITALFAIFSLPTNAGEIVSDTYTCAKIDSTKVEAWWNMNTVKGSDEYNHCGKTSYFSLCSFDEGVKHRRDVEKTRGIFRLETDTEHYVQFSLDTMVMTVKDQSNYRFDHYHCQHWQTLVEEF